MDNNEIEEVNDNSEINKLNEKNEFDQLNEKINILENRVITLENINKKNKIKKIIYYCFLIVGGITVIIIAYIIFKITYGDISTYLY